MTNYNHTVKVESTKEYREAMDAAETLGLELADVEASTYGWEAPDADAIHPKGSVTIDKVGRKYVHFDFGDEGIARAAFGTDFDGQQTYLRLRFNAANDPYK